MGESHTKVVHSYVLFMEKGGFSHKNNDLLYTSTWVNRLVTKLWWPVGLRLSPTGHHSFSTVQNSHTTTIHSIMKND